jgi:adenosylhomocysteine nucleosidase
MKPVQPTTILGAMDAEVDYFRELLKNSSTHNWHGTVFYSGLLQKQPVVIAKSNVGKVFAAMIAQHLIEEFQPQKMIFTGVAGALNNSLEIGDLVISKDCLYHDMDVTALGFKRGEIAYSDYKVFTADIGLVKKARKAKLKQGKVIVGRILTGDQFMTKTHLAKYRYLHDELAGDAIEMEGAAVGHVCTVNEIPFVIVRTISDRADHTAKVDFPKFLPTVVENSWVVVREILEK